jgi:cellulose synthase/poly-beta-1,6-N-acetylglucosamine synthase-like glycosyltransferase
MTASGERRDSALPTRLGEHLIARGQLSPGGLHHALTVQEQTGEPLGRILVALGLVRRYDLYQALSSLWGLPFVDLLKEPPDRWLAAQFKPDVMIREHFLPVRRVNGRGIEVAVARRPDRALEALLRERFGPTELTFRVTTDWDIDQVIRAGFRHEILSDATYGLCFRNPEESAYTVLTRPQYLLLAAAVLAVIGAVYLAPVAAVIGLNLLINAVFAAGIWFKFIVSLTGAGAEASVPTTDEEVAALDPRALPHYTILIPIYREAKMVPQLKASLGQLDYPREKLQVLMLLEEEDAETFAAAKAAKFADNVSLVVIPKGPPQTKPKACNVGLYFARGEYLVIYDAEDRPDPDQLKKAVVAFRKGPPNLVCVQAALNYFNERQNFLTRMFTLEYSYWFDYMLPGLERLGLPIPLGGTSNHFRTDMLRDLGGWDPFNVTEDADLGVRAQARGYRVGVINSTTYEEANSRVPNWIRQRSRWIKGYLQTTLVHLRSPRRLLRQIGWRAALGFLLLVGGTPFTFLLAIVMWAMFGVWLVARSEAFDFLFPPITLYIGLFNLLLGNGIAVYLGMLAVFKRRHYDLMPWSLLTPLYWILHSIAAWKALGQLLTRPFFWEKTDHGLTNEPWREPVDLATHTDSPAGDADVRASISAHGPVRQH